MIRAAVRTARRVGGGFKLASDFIERAALLVARRAG